MKKIVRKIAVLMAVIMSAGSLAACSGSVNGGVAKYGNEVISEKEAEFWLRYEEWFTEAYYWDMYKSFGYENMWQMPYAEDKTYGDMFHENTMSELLQTHILLDHASEYGIGDLTEEQMAKVEEVVSNLEENSSRFMSHVSATPDEIRGYMVDNAKASLVIKAIKDAAEVEVADEEINKYSVQSIMVSAPEENTEETEEAEEAEEAEETEEEKLEGLELANEILKQASAGTDMHEIADQYDGLYCSNNSYLVTGETSTAVPYTASTDMTVGEIRLAEGDKCWYIVKKIDDFNEEATEEAREQKIDEQKNAAFDTLFAEWAAKAPKFVVDEKKWAKYQLTDKIYEQDPAETEDTEEVEEEGEELEEETETEAE